MLNCCLPTISAKESLIESNLFKGNICYERLLFLYSFLENNGILLEQHPKVVSNVKKICGVNCCTVDDIEGTVLQSGLVVDVQVSCDDVGIIAESFVLY
jgi:hypothetical protein